MKPNAWKAAMPHLSHDDQEMLRQLGIATGKDGVSAALDMDIRHGLTAALGDMGHAMQNLLALFHTHGAQLPGKPAYEQILQTVARAAQDGAIWVTRSQELDQSALLALAPEPCRFMQ